MSTEHNEEKSQDKATADEKFIKELYAELEKGSDDLVAEQPSQALDESIISAAHQAASPNTTVIDIKAKKEDIKQQKASQQKAEKSPAWHLPFSLAASTVLVMILFVNQGNEAIVPQSITVPEPIITATEEESDMVFESSSSERSAVDSEYTGMNNSMAPLKMKQAPKRAAIKRVASSPYQATENKQELMVPEIAMTQGIAKNSININKKQQMNRAASGSSVNLSLPPLLSYQQYLLFKEQRLQWSLVVENKDDYLILVVIGDDKSEEYRIAKEKYTIINLPEGQGIRSSFEQIKTNNN